MAPRSTTLNTKSRDFFCFFFPQISHISERQEGNLVLMENRTFEKTSSLRWKILRQALLRHPSPNTGLRTFFKIFSLWAWKFKIPKCNLYFVYECQFYAFFNWNAKRVLQMNNLKWALGAFQEEPLMASTWYPVMYSMNMKQIIVPLQGRFAFPINYPSKDLPNSFWRRFISFNNFLFICNSV